MDQSEENRERCLSFPENGNCLLGASNRQGWNCEVCRAIEGWKAEDRSLVLLREILHHTGLYAVAADEIPDADRACYLLQLRFRDMASEDIRRTFQSILASAEQTWIAKKDRSSRVR